MERFDQRQGFLLSAIVHLGLMMLFSSNPTRPPLRMAEATPPPAAPRVRLPLAPPPALSSPRPAPPERAAPAPATPAPPAEARDRMSIGVASAEKRPDRLELRREDDLTAVARGAPDGGGAEGERRSAARPSGRSGSPAEASRPDVPAPSAADAPRVAEPPRAGAGRPPVAPGTPGPSIASSLRHLGERLEQDAMRGLRTGAGTKMGPFLFDPQGADFTAWANHFKNEVYRNWIVPQPALLGFRGHVDFEFVVERDGGISDIRLLKSAGTTALDKAAYNALAGSRPLPLPADYRPPRLVIQVTFFYNESPKG